jgi:hypothetical protein
MAKGVLSKLNQVGEQLRSKEGNIKKSMGVKGEDGDKAVYKVVFEKIEGARHRFEGDIVQCEVPMLAMASFAMISLR